MNHIKDLLQIPDEELRANVQVCLEHSCAIFLGEYKNLSQREEDYIKEAFREGGEPETDIQFKEIYDVFQSKMKATQSLWHNLGPVKTTTQIQPLRSLILGLIQVFEMSDIPSSIPPLLEALVTGQWKNFILTAVGLMSPSGMKLEVLGHIIIYLIQDEDFLGWCKREICEAKSSPSFYLYANQTMEPLEKLLGETPETGGLT
jgi:hypothetical protein